jgi:deoxyribodipyrimidine photo-lyase
LKEKVASNTLESLNLLQPWSQKLNGLWHVGENGAIKAFDNFIENGLLHYANGRDIPAKPYVSKLSSHIHFGEISLKYMVLKLEELFANSKIDRKNVDKYIAELGWREFSYHLLYHNPNLPTQNFRPEFNNFKWQENEENFKKWQKGLTGFPIVDAGMRQLWQTGFMHNRTRMIVASFLTKDLLISWQKGAMHFWHCLLDADLANNSASWQWVSGCGADAAPYFRIFNPVMQGEKNDSLGQYVKTYIPELKNIPPQFIHKPWELESVILKQYGVVLGKNYPKPMVDHANARNMALSEYKKITALSD